MAQQQRVGLQLSAHQGSYDSTRRRKTNQSPPPPSVTSRSSPEGEDSPVGVVTFLGSPQCGEAGRSSPDWEDPPFSEAEFSEWANVFGWSRDDVDVYKPESSAPSGGTYDNTSAFKEEDRPKIQSNTYTFAPEEDLESDTQKQLDDLLALWTPIPQIGEEYSQVE